MIATTTEKEDDIIADLCRENNINCFRGHPLDLLDRHYKAALEYKADVVVKIPSDCPLICPDVIDNVLEYYLENEDEFDFVSNLHPATHPDGNDDLILFCVVHQTSCGVDRIAEYIVFAASARLADLSHEGRPARTTATTSPMMAWR